MKYLELNVKTAMVVHGYDKQNKEIIEQVEEEGFTTKIVALDRVQSISEQYVLVTSSHGRVMYWEYEGSMSTIKAKLQAAGLLLT